MNRAQFVQSVTSRHQAYQRRHGSHQKHIALPSRADYSATSAVFSHLDDDSWRAFNHLKPGIAIARKAAGEKILAELKALEMTPEAAALLADLNRLEKGVKK